MVELCVRDGNQRLPDNGTDHEGGHHPTENAHGVPQTQHVQRHLHGERQNHSEHRTPERHQAIHQAKMATKIVSEDGQGRSIHKGCTDTHASSISQKQVFYASHK